MYGPHWARLYPLSLMCALVLSVSAVEAQTVVEALPGFGRPIDAQAVAARRAALAGRIGRGLVLIPAARQRDLERDVLQDNDFRQDDYFFYLTGLESPDAWLLIAAGGPPGQEAHLFLPPRNPAAERWTGRKLGPGPDAVQLTGIARVHSLEAMDSIVAAMRLGSPGPVYTVSGSALAADQRARQWLDALAGDDVRDAKAVLDSMRLVKDDHELSRLRVAIDITTGGLVAAMQAVRPGMFEYEVEALVEYTFRARGADRVGYPSIIGSGPNSTVLHYDVSRRRLEPGDVLLMDVGAEFGQYTADVTRTVPVNGEFSDRQRAIYELVLGAQQAAIDAAGPGVLLQDLDRVVREYLRTHSGTLCRPVTCDTHFVHGLTHWIGMRVHDVGEYDTPLQPGMVFTIEPGVYLPEEGLGVRIEDDVLVTETGVEILSRAAPRTVEEIEALMGERRNTP